MQQLTAGALTQILEGQKPAYPILQIIGYKPMGSDQNIGESTEGELRYRLMIGDGLRTHQYCIITNQELVQDIQSGKIEKWSIVRVNNYQTVDCDKEPGDNKRKLVYILNLEVLHKGSEVGRKLNVSPDEINGHGSTLNGNHQQQNNSAPKPYQNQPTPQPTTPRSVLTTQPQPYPMSGGDRHQMNDTRSPRPMRSSYDNQCIGIGELTPYIGKWVVKGRVTSKSAVREYNNAKGGGRLFSFSMADKTGEIKVTAFNADCERVFPFIQANKVYVLGRAQVKNADKRYSAADFEITLNSDSLLEEVTDTAAAQDVPLAKFNFVSIASMAGTQPSAPVDLIGVIISISDVSTVVSKTKNKELKKRNVTIVDMSRHTISVTIWGEPSETFSGAVGDVFVTKAARISSYGGRSASAGDCVFVDPDIPESRKMKNWYAGLLEQNFTHLTATQESGPAGDQWKSLAQCIDMEQARLNTSSGNTSAMYARCKAMLMSVGKNPVYKCCPTEGCGKKLVDTPGNELKCEKCQQTYTHYKYRYKTDIEIEDYSSSSWVTLWDEKAENLFQMKPEELERYMKMDNKEQYEKIITKPNFKTFIFTLRSRIDSYNGEERVKLTVVNCAPLDPVVYTKKIIEEIKALQVA